MTTRIKLRRDTAANWTTNDPVLALGEAGYDTTNNELRVGDGTTVWSLLSAVGGTGNKITAEKTYSGNYSNGSGQTFTYTNTNIVVQMANNDGLYLNDLLYRWSQYFDGALQFPYNYSNINLVANTDNGNIVSTVTNVVITSGGNPPLYTITLASAPGGSRTIYDIDFNYNYVNTIGLDTVNDFFGMATGDDDIDIRSGRDITLEAADDLRLSAHDNFSLTLVDGDTNLASDGIQIRTVTTSTDYGWTFRLDGSLELPNGMIIDASDSIPTVKIGGSNTQIRIDDDGAPPGLYIRTDMTGADHGWLFGYDGELVFPDATVQTTAYVASSVVNRTTGSWTLATGANTVSITVAPGNNYQMWVSGTCDNGIVEWNATVNVSNTNVPAIGSQYAWYYADGNALVLTGIPNQIVGTAGVISTATVNTTTSNVFNFGITNNSISTQTVYWGYTTL